MNPSTISMISFLTSGGRYIIQNIPVLPKRDDIVGGNGPGRRRGFHSYTQEGVISAQI